MRFSLTPALVVALIVWIAAPLAASTVQQFNLAEMIARATNIYVGTVQSAIEGTVAIGGGRLATVTYQLSVEEDLRGETPLVKGARVAEIRMLGKQASVRRGSLQSVSPLPAIPVMRVGETYLVFATPASAVGLSTTVGLGQGCFRVYGKGQEQMAVNEVNNAGLFRDMVLPGPSILAAARPGGPLPYGALRTQILNLVRAR